MRPFKSVMVSIAVSALSVAGSERPEAGATGPAARPTIPAVHRTHINYDGYQPGAAAAPAPGGGPSGVSAAVTCDESPLVGSGFRTYGWVDDVQGIAVEGEVWTFDHGIGDPWEGWTREDLTTNTFTAFQYINDPIWVAHSNGVSTPIINGSGSVWLGFHEDQADSACWDDGLGYGNNWHQELVSPQFENSIGDSVEISFDYFVNCESGFDFVRVMIETSGARTTVATFTGFGGTFGFPLGFSQKVGVTGKFNVVFEFESDVLNSDQDANYPTPYGAFGMDDFDITGIENVDGSPPPYEFESDLEDWSPGPMSGAGIDAGLNSWAGYGLPACGHGGNVVEFHNAANQHTPGQYERITSPPVDLTPYGASPLNIYAEYDIYADLALSDSVFWTWGFQYYPYVCPATGDSIWSEPAGSPYVFASAGPTCARYRSYANDSTLAPLFSAGTTLVPAGSDSVRFFLDVFSLATTNTGNVTPLFDNILMGVSRKADFVHVPSPSYPTIISAIAGTTTGDTIVVRRGTYTGPGNRDFDFDGFDRVLASEDGEANTIIDCEYQGRGLYFHSGESVASLVDGFTFIHGANSSPGALVYNVASSPVIRNCRFRYTTVLGSAYGVIRVDSGSPRYECVDVTSDTTVASGGAIRVNDGDPKFETCAIGANLCQYEVVSLTGGTPTFDDCDISSNVATYAVTVTTAMTMTNSSVSENSGLGIGLFSGPPSLVSNTTIDGNGTGGVILEQNSSTFDQCLIRLNMGAGATITNDGAAFAASEEADGAAAAVTPTSPTWIDCTISGNINTSSDGGGVFMDCNNVPVTTFQPTYINCIITGNTTLFNGGGIAVCGQALFADIAPIFENCTVSSNAADANGGGIYMAVDNGGSEVYEGMTTMDRSIMWGNCANGVGPEAYMEAQNFVAFSCSDVDSNGIDGSGEIIYGGEQVFLDPEFCDSPGCTQEGTIEGQFTISAGSPADSTNSPCGELIGAHPVSCGGPPSDAGDSDDTPAITALSQNIPNPFNPATTIRFALADAGPVRLDVYDVRGRLVRTLIDRPLAAAVHRVVWDGTDDRGRRAASGIYFARFTAGRVVETRKMVLLK